MNSFGHLSLRYIIRCIIIFKFSYYKFYAIHQIPHYLEMGKDLMKEIKHVKGMDGISQLPVLQGNTDIRPRRSVHIHRSVNM